MKVIEDLLGRAAAAEAELGELARRGIASENRRRAVQDLDDELRRMAADGWLDPAELAALSEKAEGLGIDLSLPSANGPVRVGTDTLDKAQDAIDGAIRETDDGSFEFDVQRLLSAYHGSMTGASRASKAEHEIYMAAIRNLKA